MRIQPIQSINIKRINADFQNYNLPLALTLANDTVSFGRKFMTGKEFKQFSDQMTCLYTGEPMLASQQLTKMKNKHMFEGPIGYVVENLKPYKDKYLKGIEFEIFDRIEQAAAKYPDIDLTELFRAWYKGTRSDFRKQQKPTFDKIKTLGASLPQEHQEAFFKYMELVDRKLYDEPIHKEFNLAEFGYNLKKITEKMTDTNFKNRVRYSLKELYSEESAKNKKGIAASLIRKTKNILTIKQKPERENAKKIRILENIMLASRDRGYKKIEKLCFSNIQMLKGIPIRVPFSNKSFVFDLDKVLRDCPNNEIKKEIIETAKHLPTSSVSPEAFILKLRDAEPNIIGDRLFSPSLASVEHLKPASEGGCDLMTNCALAKRWINSARKSEPLWQTLEHFPLKNQHKYAGNLLKLYSKGKVQFEDVLAQMETIEREGHIDLSFFKGKLCEIKLKKEPV